MSTTIDKILHARNLVGMIQAVKPGVTEVLPDGFLSITPKRIIGNTGTYKKVSGRRDVALAVQYGSPSRVASMKGVSDVQFTAWHSFMHMNHPAAVYAQLASGMTGQFDSGRSEIMRQTRDFAQIFENARAALRHSALFSGKIYLAEGGGLLPSSSGAVVTIDFGVPSGNQNQLDIDGAGAVIGAPWGTAGTSIIGDLEDLRDRMTKATGYVPRHIFFGSNIRGYLMNNTEIGKLLQSDAGLASSMRSRSFDFLDFTWHAASGAFYEDTSGTVRSWVGADTIVVTPDPSADWWEPVEGSFMVPGMGADQTFMDGEAALGGLEQVYGRFSYAELLKDPPGIKQYFGDTYLPLLKVPSAIAIGDVTP